MIDNLHRLSLPSMLSIIEGNAKIRIVDQQLRLRSQQLLKRGRWAPTPYVPLPKDAFKYYDRPDPATYCPMLFGEEDDWKEDDEPVGPNEIYTAQVEFGEDLTDGILAIDGTRALINMIMKELKKVTLLDIKDALTKVVEDWRDYLSRKLQYFVNMLLFPMVGCRKEKVRIHFDGCWLEPREFTVNVKPKEKRGISKESHYFLRSL